MMVLRKKTIIIATLVVLIVAAGYISTRYGKLIKVDNNEDEFSQEDLEKSDATTTNNQVAAGFFIDVKLGRENQRALDKQTLTEMINNENVSKASKQEATDKLFAIVDFSEKEMIIEALIKSKGFDDAVVFLDDSSANVTVKAKEIKADEVNTIKNIVCRESGLSATTVMIQSRE